MCGIAGFLRLDGAPIDPWSVERANTAQRHRGPDDEGYLFANTSSGRTLPCGGADSDPRLNLPRIDNLGPSAFDVALAFRRLAIVDLSPAGHQPMCRMNGATWIVFNGEIYNYVELRSELQADGYEFRSGSDTEVLLAAYERWGVSCAERLNGMWAFAIWDNRNKSLFLSRDRFGEKPLHYVHVPGRLFAFASEMKALWASGVAGRDLHPDTLARWERFGETDTGEQTFYDGILRLPQGHGLVVGLDGRCRTWRYWDIDPRNHGDVSDADATRRFAELFTDSVRIRLRSDVAVGSSLSGGLDSSTVVCVMNELLPAGAVQKTFSARTEDPSLDEGKWIAAVTAAKRVEAHSVYPRREQFVEELPTLFWHQEEPFESTSMFAQWCVMRLAKDNQVTVLLDGQGADELLAGYHQYFDDVAYGLLSEGRLLEYGRWRRTCATLHNRSVGRLGPFLRRQVPASAKRPLKRALGRDTGLADVRPLEPDYPSEFAVLSALRKKLWWNTTRHGLNVLLRYADRNSMAHSREVRLPFLDHRLVEFVFSLPDRFLLRDGYTKWILRQAFPGIVPRAISDRLDKIGYVMPQNAWTSGMSWGEVMTRELHALSDGSQEIIPDERAHRVGVR